MDPSARFEMELESFRTEYQSALQYFYAWQSFRIAVSKDKAILRAANKNAIYWNTAQAALFSSAVISLARVFQTGPDCHGVARILDHCHKNLGIFSLESLALRKMKGHSERPEWLDTYLTHANVPTTDDFRRLKNYAKKYRRIFEEAVLPLRNKVYAHLIAVDKSERTELFRKVDVREIQKIIGFLGRLYSTLWELFVNGRAPKLRPTRYSARRMSEKPLPQFRTKTVQEMVVHDTQKLLKSLVLANDT